MPIPNIPSNQDRELNVQQLDPTRLSDWLEWDTYAQSDISFRHIVEENLQPKSDALRLKMIADVNIEAARSSFARICSSTTLFRVPSAVKCDRTFARDAYDAYYLDAMHNFLQEPPGELKIEDLPLLKVPLHSRYFCAFAKRPIYYNELFQRRRTDHWVSGDCPDLEHFSDLQKAAWFPKVEYWARLIRQPPALPIPMPPSFYYYHLELRDAQRFPNTADSERIKRLRFCAKEEYHVLFLSTWWNDLIRGGRAFVIHRSTINVIEEHCGSVQNIVGKPAQAIIERMRMFADMPQHFHNWMCFNEKELEASPFIFAVKNTGAHDHTISSGRRIWCRLDHRSMTVSRYSSTTYKRLTLLDERLSGPELDEVPGLSSLVREQDWARYNSLRVSELLQNLTGLYNQTRSKLDESDRRLSHEERCHDDIRKDLDAKREEVAYLKDLLKETKYALDAVHDQRDTLVRKLDDADRHIDYLSRNRTAGSSARQQLRDHNDGEVEDGIRRQLPSSRDNRETLQSYQPAPATNTKRRAPVNLEIPRIRPYRSPMSRSVHRVTSFGTLRKPNSGVDTAIAKAIDAPSSPFIARHAAAAPENRQ